MEELSVERRMKRFVPKLLLWIGIIIGVVILDIVFIAISPEFGPLVMVFLILGFVGIQGMRLPILLRMALRNIVRRKTNTIIVVVGLMIGTIIITSSLVVGDTLENLFTREVFDEYDETDEVIFTFDFNGSYAFIPYSEYDELNQFIEADDALSEDVEEVSPEILVRVSVLDVDSGLSEAEVYLTGFDHSESEAFGSLMAESGGEITDDDLGTDPDSGLDTIAVNEELADEMDIEEGHRLQVFYGENLTRTFLVAHVVENDGRAAYAPFGSDLQGFGLYLPLDGVQELLGRPGSINLMRVSNVGDEESGMGRSDDVKDGLEPFASNRDTVLLVRTEKQDAYDAAKLGSDLFQRIFFVMGTFSIIAGIMLIINIFVLLAEERKSEMGMARAIGMNQRQLMYLFLFEGTLYALIASGVGVGMGLLVAFVIMASFGAVVGGGAAFGAFTFTAGSLIMGFVGGMVITFITILLAARKVSRINIIRAIRNIPEPRYVRRYQPSFVCETRLLRCIRDFIRDTIYSQYEVLIMALGGLMVFAALVDIGFLHNTEFGGFGGLSIFFYGLGLFLRRYISDERAFTVSGILVFLLWASPWDLFDILLGVTLEGSIESFIFTGVFLVSSSLLIIIYNSDLILTSMLRGCKFCSRSGTLAPVFKTAVSYPLNNRFRTGITISIFALIVFTVITSAFLTSLLQGNIDAIAENESGGYDLIAYSNPSTPITDLESGIEGSENLSMDDFDAVVPLFTAYVSINDVPSNGSDQVTNGEIERELSLPFSEFQEKGTWYTLIGCSEEFFAESDFKLEKYDEDTYSSEEEVWEAVRQNDSLAIADPTLTELEWGGGGGPQANEDFIIDIGDYVVIRDNATGHGKAVKIIGFHGSGFVSGIFVRADVVTSKEGFNVDSSYLTLVRFAPGTSEGKQDRLGKDLEREFLGNGMQIVLFRDAVEERLSFFVNFVDIILAFLSLGLIVGIAGLGVITIRSVSERRQQIGMLRAIGFNRSMIRHMFLIESSYIGLLGIVLGILLGIIMGIKFYLSPQLDFEGDFNIPWLTIVVVLLVSYGATLLSTLGPSRSASRIPPAEALRYVG